MELTALLFAVGCLFLMIGMIVRAHYLKWGTCEHDWQVAGKIGVIGDNPGLPDAVIHVRMCSKCKLIHQQKVSN